MHRHLRLLSPLLIIPLVAACGVTSDPPVPSASGEPGVVTSASPSSASGPRPVVITTDMGFDDLLAIYVLLRDPAVEVQAITVDGTGLVHCGPGLRNLRRILDVFGRSDIPFSCGRDAPGPGGMAFPDDWRASADDMYGVVLPPVAGTTFPPEAVDLLASSIADAPSPVTILALGPWTTLQDLFAAHPELTAKIAGIHAMAGAIDAPGNMQIGDILPSDGIEWNVGADPDSVADVLDLDMPVTLVPLDATQDVPVPADITTRLREDHSAAGADIALESYVRTPFLASTGTFWWDVAAALALTDPTLMTWEDSTIAISDRGRISRDPAGRAVRFATGADTERAQQAIIAGLRRGPGRRVPFETTGTVRVTWDGSTCRLQMPVPTRAGLATIEIVNTSSSSAGLLGAGVVEPHTWSDAVALVQDADLTDPGFVTPDWIVDLHADDIYADAGQSTSVVVELPSGTVGFMCGTGDWPNLTLVDGGSFDLQK